EGILAARGPLSPEDLQSPALPELPASVLVLPPESEWALPREDLDLPPDRPTAPEAPEFTPRTPDPVAGRTPRQDVPARRLVAENPLGAPALPSDPTATFGGG